MRAIVWSRDWRRPLRFYFPALVNHKEAAIVVLSMDTKDLSIFKDKETLARFLCPSCRHLLRDPVQPSCGHRLCKPCADTIIDNEYPPCCPLKDCQEEFTTEDGAHVRHFWHHEYWISVLSPLITRGKDFFKIWVEPHWIHIDEGLALWLTLNIYNIL